MIGTSIIAKISMSLKINLLSLLFLLILKIRNPLSFVKSIINLFIVLFLTLTN